MEHKEIELNDAKLRVWNDGTIERWFKSGWKKVKTSLVGYSVIRINKISYYCHRITAIAFLDFDINSKLDIDHIDRNKQNNNVSNLRILTHQKNMFNQNAKGCCFSKYRWQAYIKLNQKKIHLGWFKTENEAHNAYLEAKAKYHIIED